MNRISQYRLCYLLLLFMFALLLPEPNNARAQGMYGPLNHYSDIYWGLDGYVYATSQTSPSTPHPSHTYNANVKITKPNGGTITNVSGWLTDSASCIMTYNFAADEVDGTFKNDTDGGGYCGLAAIIFSTVYSAVQATVPAWVKPTTFGAFNPAAISTGSATIDLNYFYSFSALNKTFNASFGAGLTGTLTPMDITGSGSGVITVSASRVVTATYTSGTTANRGTVTAAVNCTNGTATVLTPTFVQTPPAAALPVNGGDP